MDQGLAAVLGAGVGVMGTLGTAVLTYAATRGQVRDQHRVGHAQWLRDTRQRAYTEFFLSIEHFAGASTLYRRRVVDTRQQRTINAADVEALRELGKTARQAANRINHQGVQVAVAGPEWFVDIVGDFVLAIKNYLNELDGLIPEEGQGPVGTDEDYATLDIFDEESNRRFNDLHHGARRVLERPSP